MTRIERINFLLDKYWNCETSVPEERELQTLLSSKDVPEELRHLSALFSYVKDEQSVSPSGDFDRGLKKKLEQGQDDGKQNAYVTIRIFRPLLRVAVSALLVLGVGISLYFIAKQDNRPRFVETYRDPNVAMQQATLALEKLSHALQQTETASVQTIYLIDELDIDWSAIDSLSNPVLPETDSLTQRKEGGV